ncbi:MAG: hypothetical protein E6G32_02310 [Actinobacteria bacterium]|nr:MAG: hypothetical protein E6G32_02310 [Actinomycetota bacterium]
MARARARARADDRERCRRRARSARREAQAPPRERGGLPLDGSCHIECEPGILSGPPHAHSAEEEIFVVLGGDGTLELTPSPRGAAEFDDRPETQPVRRGTVVASPPGTGVAHAFRAGDTTLTLIAWGTREPNDICWYPRSKKLFWRGVGVIGRVDMLDYWDGEELE